MEKGSLFTRIGDKKMRESYLKIIKEENSPEEVQDENPISPEDSSTEPIIDNEPSDLNELSDLGQEMDKKTKAHFDKLKSSLDKNDEERLKMLNKVSEEIVKTLSSKKLTKKEIVGILREVIRELE